MIALADALRGAIATLDAIRASKALGEGLTADYYPEGFSPANARAALAAHDAASQAGGWTVGRGGRIEHAGRVVADVTFRADHRGGEAASYADAARIVACVNAMQGVPDPWELRATLRNVIATARHTGEPVDPEALARALWGDA